MGIVKVYTRNIEGINYPSALAHSIHLSLYHEEKELLLNQNYGMLFAKASISKDNTIIELGILNPKVIHIEDQYMIIAEIVDQDGQIYDKSHFTIWTTKDFIKFTDPILEARDKYQEIYKRASESIQIPEELTTDIIDRWIPVHSVEVILPESKNLHSLDELNELKATVIYSDSSTHKKRINWDMSTLKQFEDDSNIYTIEGTIRHTPILFPRVVGYADPVIFQWENHWYLLATNDNTNDIGLYLRKASTMDGLFDDGNPFHCILDYDEKRKLKETFWAPEFHIIAGKPYVLFAVSGDFWGPQSHIMEFKIGGDLTNLDDWHDPIRVCKKDGTFLATDGITLDMTYLKVKDKSYVIWSYRYGIGTPKDSGSMLYIATIDENKPWMLTSDPVLLSRPLYGWENIQGTINNEGPYPLIVEDKVYIAFSGGSANGYSYAVGYLSASIEDNLLDPSTWSKTPCPELSSYSIAGIDGPGHNSFFYDEEGDLYIAYHGQETKHYHKRCTTYHRVHLNKQKYPLLNLSEDRDLDPSLRRISYQFHFIQS